MNRRDLLKLFGVGAAVVPIVGGAPQLAAEATLVTAPQVRPLIVPSTSSEPFDLLRTLIPKSQIQVVIKANGTAYYFAAETFVTEARAELVDVASWDTPYAREWLPDRSQEIMWQLKGRCIGTAKVTAGIS
jgi:hypothetical protein